MRTVTLELPDASIRADLDRPFDLAMPLRFGEAQLSAFGERIYYTFEEAHGRRRASQAHRRNVEGEPT